MSLSTETLRQRLARKGAWRHTQSQRQSTKPAARISTFPKQFEGLRDQLFTRAKATPDFLAMVFTAAQPIPTDDEIMQAVENRFFSIICEYPQWFGQTPDADAKAHDLRRDHDINHGFIKAAPLTEKQQAALARRKQERLDREQRIAARVSTEVATPAS